MSTSEDTNRVPVTAALAQLLLIRHNKSLPEPVAIEAKNWGVLSIELVGLNDLYVWVKAIGGKRSEITLCHFDHRPFTRHSLTQYRTQENGWRFTLFADVESGQKESPLDAETVATLEAVAANA